MSEQNKFTPGPWTLDDEFIVYAENDCNLHPVADCSGNHTCRSTDEQAANAVLIATAPEMHAALKDARDTIEIYAKLATPDWDGSVTPTSALGRIRAALAKAEGKQS